MTNTDEAQEVILVEDREVDFARETAASLNVSVHELDIRSVEPLTTGTLVLVGGSLAVATAIRLIEERRGGQVIDLRPNSSKTFYRSKDVIYGLVIVLAVDGSITIDIKEPRGALGEVLDAIIGIIPEIAGRDMEEISARICDAVADTVEVRMSSNILDLND